MPKQEGERTSLSLPDRRVQAGVGVGAGTYLEYDITCLGSTPCASKSPDLSVSQFC